MSNTPLYNVDTREPESLAPGLAEKAIVQGTHSYQAGTRVNVIGLDGTGQSVPAEQVKDAIAQGFRIETPFQGAVNDFADENKGVKGDLKAFAYKTGSELGMGVPELLHDKLGDPLEVAKKNALMDQHAISSAAGAVTGFAGSLFVGGPLFKGAGAAGKVAERALAEKLAAAGIEKGSANLAKDILARTATKGLQYGTEGAVIAAPRAITEAGLGDYNAAAESLMYGAGIGSALGVGVGALSPAFAKLTDKYQSIKDSLAKKTLQSTLEDATQAVRPDVLPPLSELPKNGTFDQSALDILGQTRGDAKDIAAAAERLGIDTDSAMFSNHKTIKNMSNMLVKDPTSTAAVKYAEEYGRRLDTIEGHTREMLGQPSSISKADLGDAIKEHIDQKFEEARGRFKEKYDSLGQTSSTVDLPDEARLKFYDKLNDRAQSWGSVGSDGSKIIREYSERILAQNNVKQLDALTSEMGAKARAASRGGDTESAAAFNYLKGESQKFSEKQMIRQAAQLQADGADGARSIAKDLINDRRSTAREYREFMGGLQDFADSAKLGRVRNVSSLQDKIARTQPEKIVDKLFDVKNARSLEYVQRNFPELFDKLSQYKKTELLGKYMTPEGRLRLQPLWNEVGALSPEARGKLFPNSQKVSDIEKVLSVMPKDPNPSGTALGLNHKGLFNPTKWPELIGNEVGDRAKIAFMKRVVDVDGILTAEQAMKRTAHRLDEIPKALKSLSGRVSANSARIRTAADSIVNQMNLGDKGDTHEQKMRKFAKTVSEYASNPQALADKVAKVSEPVSQMGAPNVGALLSQRLSGAIQYLAQVAPKANDNENPFQPQNSKISDSEVASFSRRVQTVMDPLSVIEHVKDGTLTHEHVEALAANYPALYSAVQQKVMKTVTDKKMHIPYPQRIKLGLLMKMPTDRSLSGASVTGFQNAYNRQIKPLAKSGAQLSIGHMTMTDFQKRGMK